VENTGFASLISAWFQGVTGIVVTIIIVLALLIAVIVVPVIVLKRRRKRTAAQAQQAQVAAAQAQQTVAPVPSPTPSEAPVAPTTGSPSIKSLAFEKYAPSKEEVNKGISYATKSAKNFLKSDTAKQGLSKASGYIGKFLK